MSIRQKGRAIATAAALSFAMLAGSSVSAKAVLLDFIDFIDNVNGEEAVQSTFSLGGFTITVHGFNGAVGVGDFNSGPFAYFDSGGAGIGVCQDITASAQCAPSSDDNVTGNFGNIEILTLSFDQAVNVSGLMFRDATHGTNFAGNLIDIGIVAGLFNAETLLGSGGLVGNPGYTLAANQSINLRFNNQQFYLSGLEVSAVPLPPALLLFGSALAGMGVLSRRRKQKAASA